MCWNPRPMSRQKGSASVLVIMIMLFLVSLAVLALMTAHSNFKLARKNADWVQGYYTLEAQAADNYAAASAAIDQWNDSEARDAATLEAVLGELGFESLSLTHDAEDALYTIAFATTDVASGRQFYTEFSLKVSEQTYDIQKDAWRELSPSFDYEDEIEFDDVGGN